ncbi:hypothetical protein, partial [Alloalcanivorax balearicus]|uniref:hypothetical protein n=1 Tax=Alloalcanivorax balearicus TaxID=413232 RepID=UPI0021CD9312
HTFACLIVKERWKPCFPTTSWRCLLWRGAVSAVVVGAHSRDFRQGVNTFFISFLSNGHLLSEHPLKRLFFTPQRWFFNHFRPPRLIPENKGRQWRPCGNPDLSPISCPIACAVARD